MSAIGGLDSMGRRATGAGGRRTTRRSGAAETIFLSAVGFGIARANAQQAIASMVLRAELPDTSASKILTVKLYMSGSSPEVTSLLPPFKANPREYAKDRPVALQNLHPLLSLTNANLSESQYQTSANQFCF